MRVPLIGLGVATFLIGVALTLISWAQIYGQDASLQDEREAANQEALSNSTENWERATRGLDSVESEHDTDAIETKIDSLKTRRNVGLALVGVGAIVALIGKKTPEAQSVMVVSSDESGVAGPGARSQVSGLGVEKRPGIDERLATLTRLRDSGAVTAKEYADRRQKILDDL